MLVDLLQFENAPWALCFSYKCAFFHWKHADWYKSNETYRALLQHWNVKIGCFARNQTENTKFLIGGRGAGTPENLEKFYVHVGSNQN